jgi:hypothetical protein
MCSLKLNVISVQCFVLSYVSILLLDFLNLIDRLLLNLNYIAHYRNLITETPRQMSLFLRRQAI